MTPGADQSTAAGTATGQAVPVGAATIPDADVYLVGLGNRLPNDFTVETLGVLRRCGHVFGAPPVHLPGSGLPPMRTVMHLYRRGRDWRDTHREIADLVLGAAGGGAPVALATYGSAMVGMPSSHEIVRRAPEAGLTVHVTRAVSCLDGVWATAGVDPLQGCAIWDAATLLALDVRPDPRAALLIPQVPLLAGGGRDPVSALRAHLLGSYPAGHRVHFLRCGSTLGTPSDAAVVETVPLVELCRPRRDRLATLLIPALHGDGAPAPP